MQTGRGGKNSDFLAKGFSKKPKLGAKSQKKSYPSLRERGDAKRSTLQMFGQKEFDADQVTMEYFRRKDVSTAAQYKGELQGRMVEISDSLKQHVTANYKRFITTSQSISSIEEDMVKLNELMAKYKVSQQRLANVNVNFDNDRLLQSQGTDLSTTQSSAVDLDLEALLESLADDLRSLVCERKFEAAVDTIEMAKGKIEELEKRKEHRRNQCDSSSMEHEDIRAVVMIREWTDRMVRLLAAELRNPTIKPTETRRAIGFLSRLGHEQFALSIFLQKSTLLLKADSRQVSFTGLTSVYLQELSKLVFKAVGQVGEEFPNYFRAKKLRSSLVMWVTGEIGRFARVFELQVRNNEGISRLGRAVKATMAAAAKHDRLGLGMTFLVARLITPCIVEAVEGLFVTTQAKLLQCVGSERWQSTEILVQAGSDSTKSLMVSESGKLLYDHTRALLQQLSSLIDPKALPRLTRILFAPVESGMVALMDHYLLALARAVNVNKDESFEIKQWFVMIANVHSLADDLLPRVLDTLEGLFGRPLHALRQFREAKASRMYSALLVQFCQDQVPQWMRHVLQWRVGGTQDVLAGYGCKAHSEPLAVSPQWRDMAATLQEVGLIASKAIGPDATQPVVGHAVVELFRTLAGPEAWAKETTTFPHHTPQITADGLKQMALDLRFFRLSFEPLLLPDTDDALVGALQQARTRLPNNKTIKDVLAGCEKELDAIAQAAAEEMGILMNLRNR